MRRFFFGTFFRALFGTFFGTFWDLFFGPFFGMFFGTFLEMFFGKFSERFSERCSQCLFVQASTLDHTFLELAGTRAGFRRESETNRNHMPRDGTCPSPAQPSPVRNSQRLQPKLARTQGTKRSHVLQHVGIHVDSNLTAVSTSRLSIQFNQLIFSAISWEKNCGLQPKPAQPNPPQPRTR